MRRTWFVTAVVALCTLAGLAALLRWQPQPSVAPIGTTLPFMPTDAPASVQGTVIAAETATPDTNLPPERTVVTVAAVADERPALLEVRVEQVEPPSATPLPFVEVALALDGGTSTFSARTNARGVATFELAGADGRTGVARCALGAAARVVLSAAMPARVTLSVLPRVIVQGNVVDTANRGVAAAGLLLLPWPLDENDAPVVARVGRSNADGSFRIGLATGGRFGAHHGAFGPSPMFPVRATGPEQQIPIVTLQLVLPTSAAAVAGTVRDAAGALVAGAELEFRSEGAPPRGAELRAAPQRVRTAKDGSFVATGLAAGPIDYAVRAAGQGRLAGKVQVGAGERARLDLRLPSPCALLGSVQTEDGEPVPGATVIAGVPGTFLAAGTTTDGAGKYLLIDLAPGQTPLSARGPAAAGGRPTRAAATKDLLPGAGNEWNAVLAAADDELRGIVVDATGSPLAGWRVTARAGGSARAIATTADDGSFALSPGAEQRVDLRAYAPRRSLAHFADVVQRAVARDSANVRLIVPANRFGGLQGRVETHKQLAVPATISCWHHERCELVRFVAGADGAVDLRELPVGTVDAVFEHPDHAKTARGGLVIAPDATVDLGTIVLDAGGTLFGNVRGPDGRAPDQCQLTIVGKNTRLPADYSAGAYRFAGVPAGEHLLQVQGVGVAATTFTVVIEANTETQRDIELLAGVQRRFRIDVPPDAPAQVSLALRPRSSELVWMATAVAARDAGDARHAEFLACLAPGEYEAVAWATPPWEARTPVTFVAGDESDVRLALSRR